MTTEYHAKYYSNELSRLGGSGVDRLGRALFDACVDLNPHQIEAALFALRSPISNGVLFADEVGLGKTIEAGLVLCQYWAERKRNLFVICPASLRKQWALELSEKFNLPSIVLDAKAYNNIKKNGILNPFRSPIIIICSMNYAGRHADEIKEIDWDLVVIDEAHKLKNAYRQTNRIGRNIRWATEDRKKLLLTATPLQNSLLEIYGLSTLIDDRLFGDLPSFRTQYLSYGGDTLDLRERLQAFCWRTLRSQVQEYIRFTERKLITRPFMPMEQEHKLYEAISAFLKRDGNYALPSGQKHLLILLIRKLLASSSRALAGTLEIMRDRLLKIRDEYKNNITPIEYLLFDDDINDDILDEILEDEEDLTVEIDQEVEDDEEKNDEIDIEKLNAEISELDGYIRWARSISVDSKTRALLQAIEIGFQRMTDMGASRKAVIFTESRRTQSYLKDFLESNGYAGKIITFNGTNRDPDSTAIYNNWLDKNKDSGRISNSRPVDVRTSIIDHFRDISNIMIATEAASEGVNLQFCSLVINFDLPWNPQRIEQRIGRCHRYGQKYDVVVINFLNERNEADRRVYELLEHKFNLFNGVFGSSDDVLGSLESGVDFERRVLDIYQECRTSEEIEVAFQKLQDELDEQIQTKMKDMRKLILEHFDEDVHERLKVNMSGAQERLDRIGRMFWSLTRHELSANAEFDEITYSFDLLTPPLNSIMKGRYHLISKDRVNISSEFLYRLAHPLGEYVIHQASERDCPPAEMVFDITNHPAHISIVEQLKGNAGWMILKKLRIDSFDSDEYLLFSAFDDNGSNLDQETCEKLFNCDGSATAINFIPDQVQLRLHEEAQRHVQATIARNLEQNNLHFNEARDQLDKWAEDMVKSVEKELDDTKNKIRNLQRLSRQAPTMDGQHSIQEEIIELERKKRKLRERIFDTEDEIADKRDRLVDALEKRMQQNTMIELLFTIRWRVM